MSNQIFTLSLILSSCLLVLITYVGILYKKVEALKDELKSAKEEFDNQKSKYTKEKELLTSISIGDKALISNYGLCYTEKKKEFEVTYEVEIIDISDKKVKVKSINFIPNCSVGRDPANHQGILNFIDNKWVSKSQIEIILDDAKKRDIKIDKILNN